MHFINKKHSFLFGIGKSFSPEDNALVPILMFHHNEISQNIFLSSEFRAKHGFTDINDIHVVALLNLFLYMDAFPEAIKEGPPPVRMPAGHVSKRCTIIGESEAIREVYRNGVTPHMRRGHFRFLQSERFTSCRYKTVYVKPTMVKGKASHITDQTS